jgi:hypothetical protein
LIVIIRRMGFWGYVAAARTPDPAALGVAIGAVLSDDDLGGGWRLFQAEGKGDPGRLARSIAERTGAPALAAFVLDSDCAILAAATGPGEARQIAVNPQLLEDYGPPEDEELLDGAEAVAALVAWAEAAGFEPDPDAVAAALDADETFVEEKLTALAEVISGAR